MQKLLFLAPLAPLASLALLAACGTPPVMPRVAPGVQLQSITVTSPMFAEGGRVPIDQSCDGKDLVPELVMSSPPDRTKSLLLLVDDPDSGSGAFTHLLAFNIPPDTRKIPSVADLSTLGESVRLGTNDFHAVRYSGPCPPKGEEHRYRFRVIALDAVLKLPDGASRAEVDVAIDQHVLGEGILTASFGH